MKRGEKTFPLRELFNFELFNKVYQKFIYV